MEIIAIVASPILFWIAGLFMGLALHEKREQPREQPRDSRGRFRKG